MSNQNDKSIKSYSGVRVSTKQFKRHLASANSSVEKQAIKNLYLGEPLKVFAKNMDNEDSSLVTDIPTKK